MWIGTLQLILEAKVIQVVETVKIFNALVHKEDKVDEIDITGIRIWTQPSLINAPST